MPVPVVAAVTAVKAIRGRGKRGRGKVGRRRRTKLTKSAMNELLFIKTAIGKTAAANAMPFYLGGR